LVWSPLSRLRSWPSEGTCCRLVSFLASFHRPQPDRTAADWPDPAPDLACQNRTLQLTPDGGHTPSKQQVAGSSPARGATTSTYSSRPAYWAPRGSGAAAFLADRRSAPPAAAIPACPGGQPRRYGTSTSSMQSRPLGLSRCGGGGDRTATEEAPPHLIAGHEVVGRRVRCTLRRRGPGTLFAAGAEC
jgi:hypothetical protein